MFFQNRYVHARKATNETGTGKRVLSDTRYQIPGTYYLVHIMARARNRNRHSSTWLMRFDKGTKLNRRRPIGGMNGTRRAHHRAGQWLWRTVAGRRQKRYYTIPDRQKSSCSIGAVWQNKTGAPSVRHTKKEGAERTGRTYAG